MSTISKNTTISNPDDYDWPITINGGSSSNTVTITLDNFTIGNSDTIMGYNQYFIIGSGHITITGNSSGSLINIIGPEDEYDDKYIIKLLDFIEIKYENIDVEMYIFYRFLLCNIKYIDDKYKILKEYLEEYNFLAELVNEYTLNKLPDDIVKMIVDYL